MCIRDSDEMEQRIVALMDRLDAEGGIVKAIAEGRVQADVSRQAYEQKQRVEAGDSQKVGVNCFVDDEKGPEVEFHPYRREEAEKQIARLAKVRAERNTADVERTLEAVRAAAEGGQNVMPAVIAAVKAYATVGEICRALRQVFGTYVEPVRF